jgi:hypothetical protein
LLSQNLQLTQFLVTLGQHMDCLDVNSSSKKTGQLKNKKHALKFFNLPLQ